MAYTPIVLVGDTLGDRHRYLNALVSQANNDGINIAEVEELIEKSPVDRLFKIQVASKLRHVDYILRTLQDDDLLYVSKALKSMWLLEPKYSDIINPKHLDEVIFPKMMTTAISKMKHWLYINLRQADRCLEFYRHYKEKQFDFAIKFLRNCKNECILNEFPNILNNITPHYLKIFSEKCPETAKQYYDSLEINRKLRNDYLNQQKAYFNSIKSVLKSDPNVYFYIIEKYYNLFHKLSPLASEYILKHHKSRFTSKPEWYTFRLLHIPTLARELNAEDCEALVVNLARAQYLGTWFTYKNVEPLVKRLSPDKRAAFKKRVFVVKDIGDSVKEWPYPIPKSLEREEDVPHVFDDVEPLKRSMQVNRSERLFMCKAMAYRMAGEKIISELDRIFDEYRYHGFDRTFRELSHRLGSVSSPESRRNIFLVMVSKTGGRIEHLVELLTLCERHTNEPDHIRSAIIRSLVNRAFVWRLPDDAWSTLLKFGHGLGLDGSPSEEECVEGLHAVVLRELLSSNSLEPALQKAFLKKFSNFSIYSLKVDERKIVVNGLSTLLITAADADPQNSGTYLTNLFHVYKDHRAHIEKGSDIISAAMNLYNRKPEEAQSLLHLLYNAKIGRKELFLCNFKLRNDKASYMNALRHQPNIIEGENLLNLYLNVSDNSRKNKKPRLDTFLNKLVLYFGDNLAAEVKKLLIASVEKEPRIILARPLAIFIGYDFPLYLKNITVAKNDIKFAKFGTTLRECSNLVRPKLNFDSYTVQEIGVKAIIARASVCSKLDTQKYIDKLINCRPTMKTAIHLSQKNGTETSAFSAVAQLQPTIALKAILSYFRRYGEKANIQVWDVVKKYIQNVKNLSDKRFYNVYGIPKSIKVDYYVTLLDAVSKMDANKEEWAIKNYQKYLENELPNIKKESIENILLMILKRANDSEKSPKLYPRLFVKYLLLCQSESEQNEKFERIGRPFLKCMDILPIKGNTNDFGKYLNIIQKSLKYSNAFFNTKYISCIPVFEKILEWMRQKLPFVEYLKNHVEVKLSMLYFEAIRDSINEKPHIFNDAQKKMTNGVEIVGIMFGKYIAKEMNNLTKKYFDSIIELYKDAVTYYLDTYFIYCPSKSKLIEAIIKGIMEESDGEESRLGVYILKFSQHSMCDAAHKEIREVISKTKEAKYFYYAEIC